ncbi:E motif [Dillenia turbinata]|uniref:E motif n=1 Tax=Dillenia turbinata TaxID=194707 RepID=A0AAN8ZHM5_9MAGN
MRAKPRLREAIDLLYSRGIASTETYTHLLLECVRFNDVNQAKRLQTHMEIHLYQPNSTFIHNRLLHVYAKSGESSLAQKLFDKMPQRDIFSYNALLSAYSKSGFVEDMTVLFHRMPCRDPVSYNTVISGLVGGGCLREAFDVFVGMQREGFEGTDYTYVSLLNACTKLLDLERGKQIHGRLVVCDYRGSAFIWNALSDLYAKCGAIDHARWLFDRMDNRNIVSWNSIISGYLRNGQPERCLELFHEMRVSGLMPDQVTVSNVLGAYFQTGRVDDASNMFRAIKGKADKVCWTTMIAGSVQNGREEGALMLFCEMLRENVRPDSFAISVAVSACAKLASMCDGEIIHGISVHIGIEHDLLVSSSLVDMYSKCGNTEDAWVVFKAMPTRNVVSWNSMIVGYAQNGKDSEALGLYAKMLEQNYKPDDITFVGVLSACNHAGLVKQGEEIFGSISKEHGLTPTTDHYACMINLLGRSGYIDKAVDLIRGMPHKPNSLIWSTLLSVCSVKCDIENGEMAARQLFELEPLNAGPYVMLSNMYAACGRWKDVALIRSLMKNKSVKKFAAYSWIEIDNLIHKFVSEDRLHPESKQIYEELDKIIMKLQQAGFTPNVNLVLHDVRQEEKFESICYHSEKLALAFGLLKKPNSVSPIRIMKNLRVCDDCHVFMKFVSKELIGEGKCIFLQYVKSQGNWTWIPDKNYALKQKGHLPQGRSSSFIDPVLVDSLSLLVTAWHLNARVVSARQECLRGENCDDVKGNVVSFLRASIF